MEKEMEKMREEQKAAKGDSWVEELKVNDG